MVLQHIDDEPAALIGDFFDREGIPWEIMRFYAGDEKPQDTNRWNGLVIMGGPMGVYEEHKHPWLLQEKTFIRDFVNTATHRRPILGVCLGAQLLANALDDSEVYPGPQKELGWGEVEWTSEAQRHPYFKHFPEKQTVFHWHGDTFHLPQGAIRLAGNAIYRNQAFAYGPRIVGLQFHIEVTAELIRKWIELPFSAPDIAATGGMMRLEQQLEEAEQYVPQAQESLNELLRNLFKPGVR
ncbi:type 1 glutamine amidotransferase [Candidatus Sumerlaeota bacterium]|nr:type 1 glutamine amidotransferase [Candidatus Sumerlaeota bacterium]